MLVLRMINLQLIKVTTKFEEIQLSSRDGSVLVLMLNKTTTKPPYPGLFNTFRQHNNTVDILFPNHTPEVFCSIG